MEVNELKDRTNWKLCQTHNCSADASNICLTDRVVICNMCAAVFHYDCDVKIKDGECFINHALKSCKDLVNTMINRGMETRIDRIYRNFREEISHIQDNIKLLEREIEREQIDCKNVDHFVSKTKDLVKSIMESHVYSIYTDYLVKLKLCRIIPNKHDSSEEMGLDSIRAQFYLDTKKKEMDFCEYKLKALALEMNARVSQVKQQLEQKLRAEVESRINQEADFSRTTNEELKLQIFGILDTCKQKIDQIERKQVEMKNEVDVTNRITEERQTNQDEKTDELKKRIDGLTMESSNSMEIVESSIQVIYEEIRNSNKDLKENLELKIDAAKSSLQNDLHRQPENCIQLVDQYNEEYKIKFSELNQRVETIQENLNPVTQFVNSEIQERERFEELKRQLHFRDEQFYREKFGGNVYQEFHDLFINSLATYNRLGHFKYNSEDFSLPIEVKYDSKYVYVGQFKPATNTLHGIGIRVDKYGRIWEGYWKDGNQDGNGRDIDGYSGMYYIGTYKAGCYAKGTEYNEDGSIIQTYNN